METKSCDSYEVLLYIGSMEGYRGNVFSEDDLVGEIGLFQDSYANSLPVRISSCAYIAGSKYQESGHEISVIMYPNHQRSVEEIDNFTTALGKHLMSAFKQNRITMRRVGPSWQKTTMFESESAERSMSIKEFNAKFGN